MEVKNDECTKTHSRVITSALALRDSFAPSAFFGDPPKMLPKIIFATKIVHSLSPKAYSGIRFTVLFPHLLLYSRNVLP